MIGSAAFSQTLGRMAKWLLPSANSSLIHPGCQSGNHTAKNSENGNGKSRSLRRWDHKAQREFVYAQLQREKAEYEPGSQAVYSDLGFMLLGALIEDMSGMSLDQYCWKKIYRPLGLPAIGFINLETLRQKKYEAATEMIAPTEHCPWRKRVLCGEVHDDNAFAMGGVAGHAGLFAPIDDVDRLVSSLVECYSGTHTFLPAAVVREFWTVNTAVPNSTWACGWDTPSPHGSSAGEFFLAELDRTFRLYRNLRVD